MNNVRPYTSKQLLDRVEAINGRIPNQGKYLLIGVQSLEDGFDVFDDKFYIFDGNRFIMVTSGTTNPGGRALKNFEAVNKHGAAVWKTDMFYHNLYFPGHHRGRMKALRMQKPIYHYRDSDRDERSEEQGELFYANIYGNNHGVDYDPFSRKIGRQIGGWSYGCQVMNNMYDYRNWIKASWQRNKHVDYALLKEFDV